MQVFISMQYNIVKYHHDQAYMCNHVNGGGEK